MCFCHVSLKCSVFNKKLKGAAMDPNKDKATNYFGFTRTEILELLPEKADRVLEIGCADVSTLVWIREKLSSSWVGGVELFEEAAEKARKRVDWVAYGNIETMKLPFEAASMDLILCLDVLEHLVDPWAVVRDLHRLLKPGGTFIASIPNVRHARVSVSLLFGGQWNYVDLGVLDRTHLRFFTRSTAVRLVECSGLKVDRIMPKVSRQWKWRILDSVTLNLLKPLMAYQYVIRAQNR